MPDDWSPRFVPKAVPSAQPQVDVPQVANLPRATKAEPPHPIVVQLQAANIKGWKFVPERDANNLIVEIIATPIVE